MGVLAYMHISLDLSTENAWEQQHLKSSEHILCYQAQFSPERNQASK